MRRATESSRGGRGDDIEVTIGYFGSSPEKVQLRTDSTVREAIDSVRFNLEGNETVWVNGERADLRDMLDDGDVVNIVTPKDAG